MKQICTVCGHAHAKDHPPERCPMCGAGPERFRADNQVGVTTPEEVRGRAREKLRSVCAVYPFCDGGKDRICQREAFGRPIGMGGAGLGGSFSANVSALAQVRLKTRVVGEHFSPDTTFQFFGRALSMPIMGASTSGVGRYGDAIGEAEFCQAAVEGCRKAGSLSWRGDTFFYTETDHPGLESIEEVSGDGVQIFKPRANDVLKRLIERAEKAGCPAVGVDLDGYGSTNFARAGQPVYRKSMADLCELVECTHLPFIAKGIMCTEDAEACLQAGVKILSVSNHGGRVLDTTPGVAEVLPDIAGMAGDRALVIADGGIRTGYDVLKMLALGARAVLIGRDVIRAAIGGGADGVRLHLEHLSKVLKRAMLMTGCPDLSSVDDRILA